MSTSLFENKNSLFGEDYCENGDFFPTTPSDLREGDIIFVEVPDWDVRHAQKNLRKKSPLQKNQLQRKKQPKNLLQNAQENWAERQKKQRQKEAQKAKCRWTF